MRACLAASRASTSIAVALLLWALLEALFALVELRRLVGVLREDEPSSSPQPGLERIEELVAEARAAKLEVELAEEGERGRLPAGPSLAAYRIARARATA